jgi:uncharacterized protein YndB with AHSA1/START domain
MLFRLNTEFTVAAPRAAVYAAIRDVRDWPQWWRGCERVEVLAAGVASGVGARHRILWRSRLLYRVAIDTEVIEIEPNTRVRARSRGDLDGRGTWRFSDVPGGTRVQYLWEVEIRKRWMRLGAPLLAPLFRLNHDWLMRAGTDGLALRLRTAARAAANAQLPA